jgi:hypothetical protein
MPRSKRAQSRLTYEAYQRAYSLIPNLPLEALGQAIDHADLDADTAAVQAALPAMNEALREYTTANLSALCWAGDGPRTRVRELEQTARRAKTAEERTAAHDKAERLKVRLAEMKEAKTSPARHRGDIAMPDLIDALLDAYITIFEQWPSVDSRNPETAAVRFVRAVLNAYADQIVADLASAIPPSKLRLSPAAASERVYASTFKTVLREGGRKLGG